MNGQLNKEKTLIICEDYYSICHIAGLYLIAPKNRDVLADIIKQLDTKEVRDKYDTIVFSSFAYFQTWYSSAELAELLACLAFICKKWKYKFYITDKTDDLYRLPLVQ